ncbi:hypothetical protein EON77_16510, partial [bacterium]
MVVAEDTPVVLRIAEQESLRGKIVTASAPEHGALTVTRGSAPFVVTYTPRADYHGADTFAFKVLDAGGETLIEERAEIAVTPVNDAPVAVADAASASPGQPVLVDVLQNDRDVDDTTLTLASFTQPASGVVAATGGRLELRDAAPGVVTFRYTVADAAGATASADVTVTVGAVGAGVTIDDKDPDSYIPSVGFDGMGLPDRDIYLVDSAKNLEIREKYKAYLALMLGKAGYSDTISTANAVYDFEHKVAELEWARTALRNSDLTYHKLTRDELFA